MDESMEGEDSMISNPPRQASRHRAHFAPHPSIPYPDESFDRSDVDARRQGASPAHEESWEGEPGGDGEEVDEEADEEDEEEYDARSETSSAMFDQDADPEGWARRLDELAGVLEVGEVEMRALKWGPPIEKSARGDLAVSQLPYEQFKDLINQYLTSTEWKYSTPPGLFPTVPGRADPIDAEFGPRSSGAMGFENHPIRVIGREWVGRDVGERDASNGEQSSQGTGLGIEGLPVNTRLW